MAKKPYLDKEERDIIASYTRGEFVVAPEAKALKATLKKAAASYLKKTARINSRLSEADLENINSRAAEEGMPYQTLITSVLHKFVSGRLAPRNG